jgi:allophanate hydrolase
MSAWPPSLDLGFLHAAYQSGQHTPAEVIRSIHERIEETGERPIWIYRVPLEAMLARLATLDPKLPLYGVPFAVKDNIDVAGIPTTAGCPAYSYTPKTTATVVQRLLDAGAILVGKTNLDQFATGLVGVRSPYGACSSVFDKRYISGGSSAGSAVAVAKSLVSFSLGTDTAGSGRVPAAFNNLVGLKPTRGAFSMTGVVPACRSLDCVSVFALNSVDAGKVLGVARGLDASDWSSREPRSGVGAAPWLPGPFRFGVLPAAQREFFGDTAAADLYAAAITRLESLNGQSREIDFTPFRAAAQLLYSGPWVAERLAAIEPFLRDHAEDMHPVVRNIISGATKHSAVDTFRAAYRLEELKRVADAEWARMDVLLLPTTGTTYTIEQVAADPVALNTNLGYYTNFVNLMDLAAVAVPAGFRANGLPFGVTLIGPAFTDDALLELADRFHRGAPAAKRTPACIQVAVLGAHLRGQPLNHQLTSRGARLVKTTHTAADYRFYALRDTVPPKPGLVHEPGFQGPGIEVEVWAVPSDAFGSFVAEVPPPLAIGSAKLDDGAWVKCFICEPYAVAGSREITSLGGWRKYLQVK